MRKTSVLLWLAGIQLILAVLLAGLCAYNLHATRTMNAQIRLLDQYGRNQQAMNVLAAATVEFAKTNRGFDAALVQSGLKEQTTSQSPAANAQHR